MKTAIILDTAFISTINSPDSEMRIERYSSGLNKIAEVVSKNSSAFDVYWVDNTIKLNLQYDSRLLDSIEKLPNLKAKKTFFENYYCGDGTVNKGAGLIVAWREILPDIILKNYEFVIHFEPRQEIRDFRFFEKFLREPASYFKLMRRQPDHRYWRNLLPPYANREVLTGAFCWKPAELKTYTDQKLSQGIKELAENRFHIEGDLFNYILENKIEFTPIPDFGLYWHDNLYRQKHAI